MKKKPSSPNLPAPNTAAESGSVSQCERLEQADGEMREAIAYQLGIPANSFVIDLDVVLPDEYVSAAAKAEELRRQADAARVQAAAAQRQAAALLAAQHLTVRDIGHVMGISHQRAQQLIA